MDDEVQSKAVRLRTRRYSRSPYKVQMDLVRFHNDLTREEFNLRKKLGFVDARLKIKTSNIKWTGVEKLRRCYSMINEEILNHIIEEYQSYIDAGQAPGVPTYHKMSANVRGRSDPDSLINALKLKKVKESDEWAIEVVNKVWLFQEYGFDMRGKLPPKRVAKKILQWAIDKGVVEYLINKTKTDKKTFRVRFTDKKRRKRDYKVLTEEDIEILDDDETKELDRLMWALTKAVVKNSTGRQNRRLFLTTAYHTVVNDRELIKSIEIKWLRRFGFR